jgi:hypothetical protein
MKITDEMIDSACIAWLAHELTDEPLGVVMKAVIKAAMQAAWVRFDINDKGTHPPMDEDEEGEEPVLVEFNGCYLDVACLRRNYYYGLAWSNTGDNRYVSSATRWMPLPEHKGE